MGSLHRGFYLISLGLLGFLVVFLLWLPVSASAAPVTYETVRVGNGRYTPTGVQTPITVNVKTNGVPKYHEIVPVATPSQVGKMAVRVARGGMAGLAINAAIEGLGYAIDRATNDITKPVESYPPAPDGSVQGTRTTSGGSCTTNHAPSGYDYIFVEEKPGSPTCRPNFNWKAWDCPASAPNSVNSPEYYNKCYGQTQSIEPEINWEPLTEQEFQQLYPRLASALSQAERNAILKNAIIDASPRGSSNTDRYPFSLSGNTLAMQELYSDFPDLASLLEALINSSMADYLASVDPEFQPVEGTQPLPPYTETPPLNPDVIVDLDLPPFCQWASFICEPFMGGEHPEVPKLDLEVQDYDSGLPTNAVCPSPVSVELSIFGTHELSYQPICDFAGMIRIPVIAISYLIAGFIVVGVRR